MATAAVAAEMPRRPGWGTIAAFAEGRVCGFPAERYEFMVRPGPRLAETAEIIAECLASLPPRR
jgi:iron complex transport system substrate-binding protein